MVTNEQRETLVKRWTKEECEALLENLNSPTPILGYMPPREKKDWIKLLTAKAKGA